MNHSHCKDHPSLRQQVRPAASPVSLLLVTRPSLVAAQLWLQLQGPFQYSRSRGREITRMRSSSSACQLVHAIGGHVVWAAGFTDGAMRGLASHGLNLLRSWTGTVVEQRRYSPGEGCACAPRRQMASWCISPIVWPLSPICGVVDERSKSANRTGSGWS